MMWNPINARESRTRSVRRTAYRPMPWLRPMLFGLGFTIVGAFAIYTYLLTQTFQKDAERVAGVYAEDVLPRAIAGASGPELSVVFDILKEMPISVIVTDGQGEPQNWKGISVPYPAESPEQIAEVKRIAEDMDRAMPPKDVVIPLEEGVELRWKIHVAESSFLRWAAWMPLAAAAASLTLFVLALWGFAQIKTGEQQAVWVGLAKETAHQLGTPISSLSGWIEILRAEIPESEETRRRSDEVVPEIEEDVNRLKRIANRFDQIGSEPELRSEFVTPVVDGVIEYFRTRLPSRGRDLNVERRYEADEEVPINRELLGWAFENILKNALDAVAGGRERAKIIVSARRSGDSLVLKFTDNGKGISPKDANKIFRPGFTTKKRGWGLGMTFVKRIIEDYHGGRILATSPGAGKGMTIEVRLPVA